MKLSLLLSVLGKMPLITLFFISPQHAAAQSATARSALSADKALVQAFAKANTVALTQLLDNGFTWIDSFGKSLTKTQLLEDLPPISNPEVDPQEHIYGNTALFRIDRGQLHVLRVWTKRADGWRAILYQEVLQVEKSEPPPAASDSAECENPCKSVPLQPETQSEKDAIASWQGVMRAMAANDADAYPPLIADEFTATDTHHDRPYTKADRLAQIRKQKLTGTRSIPPALITARMFDFGETVMMIAREQRPNAKPYYNTRMWLKRDGRWQMLFSFNTRIQ